jgi:hypothetical protein
MIPNLKKKIDPNLRNSGSLPKLQKTFQQILTVVEPNIATTQTEAVRFSGVKDALAQRIIETSSLKWDKIWRKSSRTRAATHPWP